MGKKILSFSLCLLLVLTGLCVPRSGPAADAAAADGGAFPLPAGPAGGGIPFVSFSHASGIYPEQSLTVTLRAPSGYTIAYTTDGTVPSSEDNSGKSELEVTLKTGSPGYLAAHRALMRYPDFNRPEVHEDLRLPAGVVLTAAPVGPDGNMAEPVSKVYYPGVNFAERFPGCLVLSVVTDPANLLDYETGILASGRYYDEWLQTDEAKEHVRLGDWWALESNSTQRGREWERPVQLQLYDAGSTPAVDCAAGIRVRGGASRRMNQKSFNFYFRGTYGTGSLEYELFPGFSSYKSFSLRAGGNNTNSVKYKDALLQELVKDREFTVFSVRPAVLFLNGEYWGPYYLTQKISGQTFRDIYGVDKDQVVVIKLSDAAGLEVEEGEDADVALYYDLEAFADRDLSDPDTYREFCSVMDISSMVDYFATRIYIGDKDWNSHNNYFLWRTRDSSYNGGRWQYILYDTEFSSGQYGMTSTAATTNHFRTALKEFPLFAAAMRNREFFGLFLAAIREIGAECYTPERVQQALDRYQAVWKPLMPDFYRRFENSSTEEKLEAQRMLQFFESRYDIIIPIVESWGDANFQ